MKVSSNVRPRIHGATTPVIRRSLTYANILAFIPTAIFLATVQYHDARFPDRWAYAFYYAFAPAIVFAACALAVFPRSDKLWLGTNLWFVLLGALTTGQAWEPLELLAGAFKESGGFVTTALIGLIASVAAPGSFVGARQSAMGSRYAWLQTGIACAVATLSYLTQGTRALSVTVPVITFMASAYLLRRKLRNAGEA